MGYEKLGGGTVLSAEMEDVGWWEEGEIWKQSEWWRSMRGPD
jgi:hypothetical protein